MNDYAEMNEWVLTLENIIKCFQEAGYKAILKNLKTAVHISLLHPQA